jgi:tetratricopeptide (TPR) repeat protein
MRVRLRHLAACLPLLLLPVARASAPRWVQVRSPHFLVLTDSSTEQARELAGQFERMRSLFLRILPNTADDPSPIEVVALKNSSEFTALEPPAYLAKGSLPLSGYFLHSPDRAYILLNLDSAPSDHPFASLYHEYTHFALRKDDWLPLWLSEGLAQFYENSTIESRDAVVGETNPEFLHVLRTNRLLPLSVLLTADAASPYYHEEQKGSLFYTESWALTHMLQTDAAAHHTQPLEAYAQLLRQGRDSLAAAAEAFGPLDQLQRRLERYVEQINFRTFTIPVADAVKPSSFPVSPVSATAANTVRAEVLTWDGRTQDAQALLDEILEREPHNADAVEAMGSLCYARRDEPCARKWFAEAVRLNSASYVALYFYANAAMLDQDVSHDAAIESSLRLAIQLAPSYAPAYDGLARFDMQRRKNLEEARTLCQKAIELEPQEIGYRLNLAALLLLLQEPETALRVLDAAMHAARSPGDVAKIETLVGQVKHFQLYLKNMQPPAAATH